MLRLRSYENPLANVGTAREVEQKGLIKRKGKKKKTTTHLGSTIKDLGKSQEQWCTPFIEADGPL